MSLFDIDIQDENKIEIFKKDIIERFNKYKIVWIK